MVAVTLNDNTFQFIARQTESISGNTLICVKKQTPEICVTIVKNNGYSMSHVQTHDICLANIMNFWMNMH